MGQLDYNITDGKRVLWNGANSEIILVSELFIGNGDIFTASDQNFHRNGANIHQNVSPDLI